MSLLSRPGLSLGEIFLCLALFNFLSFKVIAQDSVCPCAFGSVCVHFTVSEKVNVMISMMDLKELKSHFWH